MSIFKVKSGLIFDDRFKELDTVRWTVTPTEYSHIGDNGLVVQHSETGESKALFEFPSGEEEVLFEVRANYYPTELGDEGGVVVWKSAREKVEFLESVDNQGDGDYSLWRVIKKGNLFTFYAFRGGSWELFDSTICINPVLAGVVLKGENREGYTDMEVGKVVLCKGSNITIGNVQEHHIVTLLDEAGEEKRRATVPEGYSGIVLELPQVPFNGRIEVLEPEQESPVYEGVDDTLMYGGDVYMTGASLKVYWNEVELSLVSPTNLGALKNNEIEEKMTIVNETEGNIASNVKIKVSVYDEEFGWEWAEVSLDVAGEPSNYSKEVTVGTIQPKEQVDFWVRVKKTEDIFKIKPAMFMLDIEKE